MFFVYLGDIWGFLDGFVREEIKIFSEGFYDFKRGDKTGERFVKNV